MTIDYTIGDDIVAIKSHSQNTYKEGDVFTCIGLKQSPCKCKMFTVDINIRSAYKEMLCLHCNYTFKSNNNWWFNANLFRKLDNLVQINEINEILKQPAKV